MPRLPDAVQAAYAKHRPAVYARCVSMLKDAALAEDATQDVFIKYAQHDAVLKSPLAWLLQTATNHCLNLTRGKGRTESLDARLEKNEDGEGQEPSQRVTAKYEAKEFSDKLLDELGTISRQVAVSVLGHEEERQDVAKALKVSRKTVTRKLAKISARAQQLLTRKRNG
jgi:RNA polymerase sigma factor (sigma-70 family)